ncbi:MAG: Lrp/AsnC family transcriptional regulator [Candidatus Aenigmatarchaeota archaeon]
MKTKNFLDKVNLEIISELTKNGRVKLTKIAEKLNITPAAVKERIDRLMKKKIITVSALINSELIYPLSASIGIEADVDGTNIIIRKLRNCPLVFHLAKTSGNHNLIVNVAAKDIAQLEDFLNRQIRSEPGIKHVEVNLSNSLIFPKYLPLRLFPATNSEFVPCGLRIDDEERCLNCPEIEKGKE